jgi:hypothetical protein
MGRASPSCSPGFLKHMHRCKVGGPSSGQATVAFMQPLPQVHGGNLGIITHDNGGAGETYHFT